MKAIHQASLLLFIVLSTAVSVCEAAKFKCQLNDRATSPNLGQGKDAFSITTPEIFLNCVSTQAVKGEQVKAVWIAADSNNVVPANYKFAEKTLDVTKDMSAGEAFDATLSVTKPNQGWLVGSYNVELYVGGNLDGTYKFTVK